jgi:predicted transcriptional regulator
MKIGEIKDLLKAEVLAGENQLECEVHSACASDMMSDVLAFVKDQAVLLTGLVNPQVIRTAEMMDMKCVVFVRKKVPNEDIIELARESGIVIMRSDLRMFEACGILYSAGLKGHHKGGN